MWVGNQQSVNISPNPVCFAQSYVQGLPFAMSYLTGLTPLSLLRGIGVSDQFSSSFQIALLISIAGWTYQGVTINNCQVGFDITTGGAATNTQVRSELSF